MWWVNGFFTKRFKDVKFFFKQKKNIKCIFLRFIRTLNVLFKDVYKKKYLTYFT